MSAEASPVGRFLHWALTVGPVMRLKRGLRNLVWSVRGSSIENPPWPSPVRSILFVCYGNICRSPFAALLLNQRLHAAGVRTVRCASAGLRANQSATSPGDAVRAAQGYGVDLRANRPELLTPELVRSHDVVFVMEPAHLDELRRRWPDDRDRFFLLPVFDTPPLPLGAFERWHFVDPFGRGPAAFAESYERIARAVDAVVAQVVTPRP